MADRHAVNAAGACVVLHFLPSDPKRSFGDNFVDQTEPLVSFQPSFKGHEHALCPHLAFGSMALPRDLFRLLIRFRNLRGLLFAWWVHRAFAFLPPFAPRALPRFFATIAALTSARHPCGCSVRADLLHSHAFSFPDLPPPTTRTFSADAAAYAHRGCRTFVVRQASPFPSKLAVAVRAESCSFVIAVDLVLSVALHPASRRRSYFKFSPAQRRPVAEVSHLGRGRCFAAH